MCLWDAAKAKSLYPSEFSMLTCPLLHLESDWMDYSDHGKIKTLDEDQFKMAIGFTLGTPGYQYMGDEWSWEDLQDQ